MNLYISQGNTKPGQWRHIDNTYYSYDIGSDIMVGLSAALVYSKNVAPQKMCWHNHSYFSGKCSFSHMVLNSLLNDLTWMTLKPRVWSCGINMCLIMCPLEPPVVWSLLYRHRDEVKEEHMHSRGFHFCSDSHWTRDSMSHNYVTVSHA